MAKAEKDVIQKKTNDQNKLTKEQKREKKLKKAAFYILKHLRVSPDYPGEGVLFNDLASVLATPKGSRYVKRLMSNLFDPASYNAIIVAESRGFLVKDFAKDKFVLVGWKPSPSHDPFPVVKKSHESEYTTETFQTSIDYVERFKKWCAKRGKEPSVLIVDDLLATGGSAIALAEILKDQGCTVTGVATLFGLTDTTKAEGLYEQLEVRSALKLKDVLLREVAAKKSFAGKKLAQKIYADQSTFREE